MSAHAPLENVPDPRSKHGTSHPFTTTLAVVLLGCGDKTNEPGCLAVLLENNMATLCAVLYGDQWKLYWNNAK